MKSIDFKFTRVNVDGKRFTRRFQISPFSNLPGSVWTGPKKHEIISSRNQVGNQNTEMLSLNGTVSFNSSRKTDLRFAKIWYCYIFRGVGKLSDCGKNFLSCKKY